MRRSLLAVVAVASLALALAAPAAAGAAGAKSEQHASSEARARAAEHQRILDYWTEERRANAKPRDIVLPLGTRPRPAAQPTTRAKPGGSTSPSASSTGATWSFGGDVAKTTGKVFFNLGGSNYVCSGSAVESPAGTDVVSTAGHCVHKGDGSGASGYATNFAFYPAWTGSTSTAPKYTGVELVATANWQARGAAHGAYPDDAAFVRVTGTRSFEDALGAPAPPVSFTRTTNGQMYAFGYPAAQKYKGNTLIYCSGQVALGYYDGDDTISMPCDMTGGSSGGPWFKDWNPLTKSGVQTSVNSYGYSGFTRMWGPVFDGQESDAYTAASS